MIGMPEIITIVVLIGICALFGRKTIKKLARDFFGMKKDIEEVRQEVKDVAKV